MAFLRFPTLQAQVKDLGWTLQKAAKGYEVQRGKGKKKESVAIATLAGVASWIEEAEAAKEAVVESQEVNEAESTENESEAIETEQAVITEVNPFASSTLYHRNTVKSLHPSSLVFYIHDDACLAYDEDAAIASEKLGITLMETEPKTAGFPVNAFAHYVSSCLIKGLSVNVCYMDFDEPPQSELELIDNILRSLHPDSGCIISRDPDLNPDASAWSLISLAPVIPAEVSSDEPKTSIDSDEEYGEEEYLESPEEADEPESLPINDEPQEQEKPEGDRTPNEITPSTDSYKSDARIPHNARQALTQCWALPSVIEKGGCSKADLVSAFELEENMNDLEIAGELAIAGVSLKILQVAGDRLYYPMAQQID